MKPALSASPQSASDARWEARTSTGRSRRHCWDRGAAAVEFALVVPVLLLLVLGIAEFGRAYNIQTTISGAAREGVRTMALENDSGAARAATRNAAPALNLSDSQISVSPTTCPDPGTSPTISATVTVTYRMSFVTHLFGNSLTLSGVGVMRCNG